MEPARAGLGRVGALMHRIQKRRSGLADVEDNHTQRVDCAFEHFLAVARHGSTTAAGRALELDQSTVQRRLAHLEKHVGQALVERSPSGYRLTTYGRLLLPYAEKVEQDIVAFQDRLRTSARELNGAIRLTCPEPIVARITRSPLLERL